MNKPVSSLDGVTPLLHAAPSAWAVLQARGADAADYLQRQLSNDVASMLPDEARLAAWCNAKGRMLASFIVLRAPSAESEDAWLLLCPHDLLPGLLKKMHMYILRSKVVLEDVTAQYTLHGLMGTAAEQHWQAAGGSLPPSPWRTLSQPHTQTIVLPPASLVPPAQSAALPRLLCLQTREQPAPQGPTLPLACWAWGEAASGVATIGQACSELFVPQMVNFESVGGVNFKKGCYPGQEVVARSQFRGAIKRRGHIATFACKDGEPAPQAGDTVWQLPADTSENPVPEADACGTVVQAACYGGHGVAFVSLHNQAAEAAASGQMRLHAGSATGAELALHPLPYSFIEV
ncbi:MAG: folate-binding protein [Brachymonas sp.]|nr:folate-binding protein [Brachymonas sp.]